ncbi:hypothetical protein PSE10B_55550 [Pseudomonas amygdali pv. eriobotryae]|nr:hypothetical protein [Pseudomonas amygdali]GFZ69033.1 hypothetical protein PSE10B_55550 [Pseudomonas amygdali pv. eriobotryae]
MDKQLIEFDNAVEALGDSMLSNMPQNRIKDIQQFREYFEQVADVQLRKLGLRLIDECISFAYMFRMGVDYSKVFDKSLEIGHLREEVTRRGLRLDRSTQA